MAEKMNRIRTGTMLSHEKTAKVLIQEQERWFIMKRLQKSSFRKKNDDLTWKDCKSLDSRTRTMISYKNTVLQKSWFKKRTIVSHKKTAKVLLKNNNYDISRNDCKNLYSRTRTMTMIYHEMTAKVLNQKQERWYLIWTSLRAVQQREF